MTRLDSEEEKGAPPTTIREISVLKRMDHPNIVRLLDVVRADGRELHLVFEYLDHDLRTYTGEFSVGPDMVKKFMRDLIRGILYCHSNGVLHRDIKPENLLIDGEGNLKIADFGLARAFGVPLREYTNRVRQGVRTGGDPLFFFSRSKFKLMVEIGRFAMVSLPRAPSRGTTVLDRRRHVVRWLHLRPDVHRQAALPGKD